MRRFRTKLANLFWSKPSHGDNKSSEHPRTSASTNSTQPTTSTPVSHSELDKVITEGIPEDSTKIYHQYEKSCVAFEGMTPEEISRIQSSWQLLEKRMEHIGVVTFFGFLEKESEFRSILTSPGDTDATFTKRCLVKIKSIDKIISQLNEPGAFKTIVIPIGTRHYSRLQKLDLFAQATNILYNLIKRKLGEEQQWDEELSRLWRTFIDHLSDTLTYALVTRIHFMPWLNRC